MKRNFERRGGCHDALIKLEAIKGIKIPSDLHIYEDWYIKKHIEKKGFKAIAPQELYCLHYFNPEYSLNIVKEIAKLQLKYKLQTKPITLRNLLLAIPKSTAILLATLDLKAATQQLKYYTYNFIGALL